MPLFFLGTREWRNRQTRTVQVRVPVMEWGFNSPLAHDETADPFGICGFCFPWLLLVDPRVFRAPEGPAAVCAGGRWPASLMVLLVAPRVFRAPEGPAAREARRPHFVRRRASKPARALRSLRRPPHRRCLRFWCARGLRTAREPSAPRASLGASSRSPARPRHRPRAPQPGPATARETRQPRFARCRVSKPARALRSLRRPPHQSGLVY